ncbi:methyltransferase [Aminivibrio sp.]|jgi:tRNA1(Val) A37 N6-methylase TrmN6|uniref:tRNA1(Val) (adenine(37)-N6)-methyltransferase n=1 Tax=Aminivibrio sp. TaxID=1872489 RepID=UPI001A44E55C|nr:methyltransferase [Aminivibrio sp.]MBL3539114.1 methyltransferase [Aminivibrio sp.]MDK2958125.1 tRNA1Val (adenine37-N6)-methyltransferase [Synergistaceae bacterium]
MTVTRDDLLYGALTLRQPAGGPRVNVDTILLAAYVRDTFPRSGGRVMELGCASGAVSLILALRFPAVAVTGLEIQDELAALAEENAVLNGLSERVSVVRGDLRNSGALFPPQLFDCVAMNPPYEEPGCGRPSASSSDRPARQGIWCSLGDMAAAARYLLKHRGRMYVVFRAGRTAELLASLSEQGLEPKRIRFVHPLPGRKASVVLVEALRGGKPGMTVEPPLYIEDGRGNYTEELLAAYTKEGLPCRSQ